MKNTRFLFFVLLFAASLTLFSCGGLLSSRHKTADCSFSINPEKIVSAARTIWDPDEIRITAHLYSEDSSYNQFSRQTIVIANCSYDENGDLIYPPISFSFSNIPLHTPLCLKIDCTKALLTGEEEPWLTTVTKRFTLDSSKPVNLESHFFYDITTRFVLQNRYGRAFDIEELPDINDDGTFDTPSDSTSFNNLYYPGAYCYYGFAEGSQPNLTYLISEQSYYFQGSEVNVPNYYVQSLLCDPVTKKICVVYYEDAPLQWKAASFDYSDLTNMNSALSEHGVSLTTPPFSKQAGISYNPNEFCEPVAYAYDGYLYTLRTFDLYDGCPEVTLCKFNLKNGSLVSSTQVKIPELAPSSLPDDHWINCEFEFNDMAVSDGLIYILFHQSEIWITNGAYESENRDFSCSPAENIDTVSEKKPAYIDRGGILVYDTETLKKTKTLGLAPVQKTLDVKFSTSFDYSPDGEYFLYRNYNSNTGTFSNPLVYKAPITWSVAKRGSLNLAGPQKIVGIMPKKLVIVDNGVFMYEEGGIASQDDYDLVEQMAQPGSYHKEIVRESRIITVDLEDFSSSVIEGNFTSSGNFYRKDNSATAFSVTYVEECTDSNPVYAKKIWKDENNHFHTDPVKYPDENGTPDEYVYANLGFLFYAK